jgi:hypothetical protein
MLASVSLTAAAANLPYREVNPRDCSESAKAQRSRDAQAALGHGDEAKATRLIKEAVNCHFSGNQAAGRHTIDGAE